MIIGVPKEIKVHEYRVGLVPSSVQELVAQGHEVVVQTKTGEGIGVSDSAYEKVGAKILPTAEDVFAAADMIVKVKEPQLQECALLKPGQILFTFLHLAADKEQAEGLLKSDAIAIAYDTVADHNGRLPLLTPMSEVAGRMSVHVGAKCLEKEQGGSGILLGGVPGVLPANVVILGGGVVGTQAARMAMGLEAQVTIIDKSLHRLSELNMIFGSRLHTVYSTLESIDHHVAQADLLIGAVLLPGAAAPKLVKEETVKKMRPGSVIVDVAIDQGGCVETSKPTTHSFPTFIQHGVVHYCVTNMPGGVARTSAFALNNATFPYILELANKGHKKALLENSHLMKGLNVYRGHITYQAVAKDLGYAYSDPVTLI